MVLECQHLDIRSQKLHAYLASQLTYLLPQSQQNSYNFTIQYMSTVKPLLKYACIFRQWRLIHLRVILSMHMQVCSNSTSYWSSPYRWVRYEIVWPVSGLHFVAAIIYSTINCVVIINLTCSAYSLLLSISESAWLSQERRMNVFSSCLYWVTVADPVGGLNTPWPWWQAWRIESKASY